MKNNNVERIKSGFEKYFSGSPLIIRSPGRINLIGEHTDYNEGFVLPAAIDKEIVMVISSRDDRNCNIYALDMEDHYECNLEEIRRSEKGWPNYILGVINQIENAGIKINGFNCVFGGDIPIASGLSSSAALEGSITFALNEIYDLKIDKIKLAQIGQRAENDFVGVQCGIMDQFTNILSKEKSVICLDCRSLEYSYYPFNREDIKIVLCDTQIRRELASSEYNVRRNQCESGVKILSQFNPEIKSLRDINLSFLQSHKSNLDPVVFKRCEYVVRENDRVIQACEDLKKDDFESFGRRMFESHAGLKDDYEVSCRELDILVEIAKEINGVLGSRMMGAGFGGCTINLVKEECVEEFKSIMGSKYKVKTEKDIKIYSCNISSGTSKILHELTEV